MKRFLYKIIIFSFLFSLIYFAIFLLADGDTDAFYLRFTSDSQSSLILGTSRSAQGLMPSIFNETLQREDLYNYSFTMVNSPYGPVYLNSIKRKLNKASTDGIFILSVDPWSVSVNSNDPENIDGFIENDLFLSRMTFVNMYPNFEYLIFEYQGSYLRIIINAVKRLMGKKNINPVSLQNDGWLEIDIDMSQEAVEQRTESKVEEYRYENLPTYKPSDTRFSYLKKTISYLSNHGAVYLVRLPVDDQILAIEEDLYPDFDERISELSRSLNIPYLSLQETSTDYSFTDGNHLSQESAKIVSRQVADWIKNENYFN